MNVIEKSIKLIDDGHIEQAVELLRNHMESAHDEEKYQIATIFSQLGLINDAIEIMEDLATLYPEEYDMLLMLAELYIEIDEDDKSIDILSTIPKEDEVYSRALLLEADIYQIQGFPEIAEKKLIEAKEYTTETDYIDFGLAELYYHHNGIQNAVNLYQKLRESYDEIAGISLDSRLAECFSLLGEFEAAIPYYKEAVQKNDDAHMLLAYAYSLREADLPYEAEKIYEQLIQTEPDYAAPYISYATFLEEQNENERAIAQLKKALVVEPYAQEAYGALANLYNNEREYGLTRELLEKGFEAVDPSLEMMYLYVKALLEQEEYEEVIAFISKMEEEGEEDPIFEWELGFAKNKLEQYEEAINHYKAAYTVLQNNQTFMEDYLDILLSEGLRKDALQVAKEILAMDAANEKIQELVWQLEQDSPFQ